MAGTRKARVPMTEQIRLIIECRQSGMTDADWCRENGIAVSTCYENKTRSQELNLDNKCFQQSWKHHDKAVVKMAAVSEILVLQKKSGLCFHMVAMLL